MGIVCHGTGDFGGAKGVVHEVGLSTADCGIDIFVVYAGVGLEALLPLINERHSRKQDHRNTEVCNQDQRKSCATGTSEEVRGGSGRVH